MIVLVTGGREYKNRDFVFTSLDFLHARVTITKLVHGAARGADTLAGEWAMMRGVSCRPYPVSAQDGPWPGAGHARNRRMYLDARPHYIVAFPGGRGTNGMVDFVKSQIDSSPLLWDLRFYGAVCT